MILEKNASGSTFVGFVAIKKGGYNGKNCLYYIFNYPIYSYTSLSNR
jgi:hypothetical protein